eukprot:16134886-Heterocapsa_arctica.AAC.1
MRRKERRTLLFGLLDRIQEVLYTATEMQPPFHGEVGGHNAEVIGEAINRRSRMNIGWLWEGDSVEQFQWE